MLWPVAPWAAGEDAAGVCALFLVESVCVLLDVVVIVV